MKRLTQSFKKAVITRLNTLILLEENADFKRGYKAYLKQIAM